MPRIRPANAPEQSTFIFILPAPMKAKIYSIAKKRGEAAAVVVREFLRRGLNDAA
jgi:hypothetical protein